MCSYLIIQLIVVATIYTIFDKFENRKEKNDKHHGQDCSVSEFLIHTNEAAHDYNLLCGNDK
jgi:hypothetical protein